jgi:hypothetical protein
VRENEKVKTWAKHKKDPVIAAGLNQHCSLMPKEVWDRLRTNTNAVEQNYNKFYALGRQRQLVLAIL